MDKRLQVNLDLCFICQETEPKHTVTRDNESFNICDNCLALVNSEQRVRKIMYENPIFRMTFGAPLPKTIRSKSFKASNKSSELTGKNME